jgi:nucleoid DNA-binding protein
MVTKYMAQAVKERIPDMDLKTVQMVCETFCETILGEVMGGNDVILRNFAKFKRAVRNPRDFTNVNSGKVTHKPKRYALSISVMAATKVAFEALEVDSDDDGKKKVTDDSDSESDEIKPKKKAAKKVVKKVVKNVAKNDVKNADENEVPKKKVAKKVVDIDDSNSEVPKPSNGSNPTVDSSFDSPELPMLPLPVPVPLAPKKKVPNKADAKPNDAKPNDAKPNDAKPNDAKPNDAKPNDSSDDSSTVPKKKVPNKVVKPKVIAKCDSENDSENDSDSLLVSSKNMDVDSDSSGCPKPPIVKDIMNESESDDGL